MGFDTADLPSRGKAQTVAGGVKQLGQEIKAEFPFDPEWRNLNHGTSNFTCHPAGHC